MTTHPELEDLSGFVDGEAPEWREHLESCGVCQAEVARLRAVAAIVGQPVAPLPSGAREQALAAALDAFDRRAHADGGGRGTQRVAPVASLPQPSGTPVAPRHRRVPNRTLVALGSIAAVAMAVVAGASVLRGSGGGTATQTLASGARNGAESVAAPALGTDQTATADAKAPSPGAGGVDGGDLGAIDGPATLAARAGPAATSAAEAAARAAGPDAMAAPPEAPLAAGERAGNLAPGLVGTRPCEAEVRATRSDLGPVVYFATATTGGRPAYVLGFGLAAGGRAVTLLVPVQEGCSVAVEAVLP